MPTAKKLIKKLIKNKLSLAVAESASGGYTSYLLTKTPGSSKVFKGGLVVYSLEAKNKLLGLPIKNLKKTQGVSKSVALALAKGIRKKLNADIGASLVGFAGPDSPKGIKPGTFFIAVSFKKTRSKKIFIQGTRDQVRKKASQLLIRLIYESFYRY